MSPDECSLPLILLTEHEVCPKCGHEAGEHRAWRYEKARTRPAPRSEAPSVQVELPPANLVIPRQALAELHEKLAHAQSEAKRLYCLLEQTMVAWDLLEHVRKETQKGRDAYEAPAIAYAAEFATPPDEPSG